MVSPQCRIGIPACFRSMQCKRQQRQRCLWYGFATQQSRLQTLPLLDGVYFEQKRQEVGQFKSKDSCRMFSEVGKRLPFSHWHTIASVTFNSVAKCLSGWLCSLRHWVIFCPTNVQRLLHRFPFFLLAMATTFVVAQTSYIIRSLYQVWRNVHPAPDDFLLCHMVCLNKKSRIT